MLSTRSLRHSSPDGSAAVARHRLLQDRPHRAARQGTSVPVPRRTESIPLLSPDDQRALVQAVAANFHTCYLAQITYLEECNLTVATLLPRAAQLDPAGAQRISVDAAGNVSVSPWTPPSAPPRPASFVRRLFTGVALTVFIISSIITVYIISLAL